MFVYLCPSHDGNNIFFGGENGRFLKKFPIFWGKNGIEFVGGKILELISYVFKSII
jgi:hypothetical protein